MNDIKMINKNVAKIHEWLHCIEIALNLEPKHKNEALALLRAVLQTLREHLTIHELANFSAQLPIVIRGLLYEDWVPQRTLIKDRSKQNFINEVSTKIPEVYKKSDVEQVIQAVFNTIAIKIDYAEFTKLLSSLPHHIREMVIGYTLFS